jgi:hypothetical protein
MKETTSPRLITLLCAIFISGVITTSVSADSRDYARNDDDRSHGRNGGDESHDGFHSVNGFGIVHIPNDFFFPGSVSFYESYTIFARQDCDGTVKGKLIVEAWSESDPASRTTTVIDVNCLTVTGNTAYYGGVVRWTNDPFAFVGLDTVGYATDAKKRAGPDLTWFGPAILFLAAGQDCTAQPVMPQMPIVSGHYIVR